MNHIFSIEFIKKYKQQTQLREIKALPKQIAFNLLMAIVPLIIVIVQITTYFSIQTDFIRNILVTYIQNEEIVAFFDEFFISSTISPSSFFLIVITYVPFFWSISQGFHGISIAANSIYQVPLMKFAFLERILSFLMVCLLVFLLILVILFTTFGHHLLNLFLHVNDIYLPNSFINLLSIGTTVIAFLSYLIFFLSLFYLAPSIRLKFSEIIPGALVAAIGWSFTSVGFSFYVNQIANYSIYGSLAVIIILLLWLSNLGFMINVGLQINYILKRDYFGGITYIPKLSFLQKYNFLSKWISYTQRKEDIPK